MNRACFALLLSLSWTAACGARSELIVRDPDAAAVTPSSPPGCQWQLGERRTIATDIDRPAANVGALSTVFGLASSHVVAAWNMVDTRPGERTSQYRVLSLQLDFEGRQLGATQTLFSMAEPNLLLGVLTPPLLAHLARLRDARTSRKHRLQRGSHGPHARVALGVCVVCSRGASKVSPRCSSRSQPMPAW
jgi:hypothetical protein